MNRELQDALSKPFGHEAIRQKRGQGGRTMDYVSHGMVTKRLNDIAPDWTAEMVERYVVETDGKLHCLGGVMRLTIGGVTHEEAGGPARLTSLADDLKNTYSDCLKRCAMRFGVALDLWESAEENDEDAQGEQSAPVERRPAPRQEPRPLRVSAPVVKVTPPEDVRDWGWNEFWPWAKARGINDRQALDAAAGEATSGRTPAEIRRLIEARAAAS